MPGPLFSDGNQGTVEKEPKGQPTADDVLDLLSQDDDNDKTDKTDKDDDKKDEDDKPTRRRDRSDKDDKDDDDEDEDIKLKEDDDDEKIKLEDDEDEDKKEKKASDEDEIEVDAPPRKKEILAKYPKLFKDFPHLEKMMYRDRQYTELFGSFDDAKDASERVQILNRFETDLSQGNTATVLKQVKELDKEAYDRIIDNYIDVLGTFDKEAQAEVISNLGKSFIASMAKEAQKISENNKDGAKILRQAALVLNQWLFGSDEFTPIKPRVQKNEADDAVKQEQQQYVRQRFDDSRNELQGKVDNILKSTISDYIDRNGEMTKFVKKHAIASALKAVHKAIGGDAAFRKSLDRLWENAYSERFSRNSLDRIKSAYLGKSKQLLPAAIKSARAEALKDSTPSRRVNDEDDDREERPRRTSTNSGRPRQVNSGKTKGMEKGESVLEFLSRD